MLSHQQKARFDVIGSRCRGGTCWGCARDCWHPTVRCCARSIVYQTRGVKAACVDKVRRAGIILGRVVLLRSTACGVRVSKIGEKRPRERRRVAYQQKHAASKKHNHAHGNEHGRRIVRTHSHGNETASLAGHLMSDPNGSQHKVARYMHIACHVVADVPQHGKRECVCDGDQCRAHLHELRGEAGEQKHADDEQHQGHVPQCRKAQAPPFHQDMPQYARTQKAGHELMEHSHRGGKLDGLAVGETAREPQSEAE